MSSPLRSRSSGFRRQRGAAFLILVMMLAIAAVSFIVFAAPGERNQLAASQKTTEALEAARDALIGFAAARVSNTDRLGDLPCPAISYATGDAGTTCSTATSRIGFLPWRTLGIPDLRDGSGAPLLYAVSNGFKNNPRTGILNSDTAGDFTVAGENAIAIVLAPGLPIGTQDRSVATFNVANFLELGNADGNNVFDISTETATFNDRLLWITPRAFFPPLEQRAMRVAQQALLNYFSLTNRFPFADQYLGGASCQTSGGGRIPYFGSSCLPAGNGATAGAWAPGTDWPPWFWNNYWDYVLHYAPAERCVTTSGSICDGSGNYLRVNGSGSIRALLIRQSIPNGQTRPCSLPSQCLDDGANSDGDRDYITPVAGNDRLTIVSP